MKCWFKKIKKHQRKKIRQKKIKKRNQILNKLRKKNYQNKFIKENYLKLYLKKTSKNIKKIINKT